MTYATVSAAIAALLVFLHWLFVQPTPFPTNAPLVSSLFSPFLLVHREIGVGWSWVRQISLTIVSLTGLISCALSLMLVFKAKPSLPNRKLAAALALGSWAGAYFAIAPLYSNYLSSWGWQSGIPLQFCLQLLGYLAGLGAPILLAQFFLAYPKSPTEEQWLNHYIRVADDYRLKAATGWRKYFYPRWAGLPEGTFAPPVPKSKLLDRFQLLDSPWAKTNFVMYFQTNRLLPWLAGLAVLAAIVDVFTFNVIGSHGLVRNSWTSGLMLLRVGTGAICYLLIFALMAVVIEALKYHRHNAMPTDRNRIDWIYVTTVIFGLICVFFPGSWLLFLSFLIPSVQIHLEAHSIALPATILWMGPPLICFQLFILAFVISLGLSIFYRGTVDPRLVARKVTVFGALGMLVALLFILVERTVALAIIDFFGLSPDTGLLITGAAVTATVAPIKNHAENAINSFVSRHLPLDSMIQGEHKVFVVAITDLSGYTLMSSHDEKQALLLASLLQRQAKRLVEMHGGRIVKSMGDAVMFAFEDAMSATHVLSTLHRDFGAAAEQFGLVALPVHSGAHIGEVVVALDGDLYGQTVNVAARIQGAAVPGQIVVSDAFAAAAGDICQFRQLGAKQFKNVPNPVLCSELVAALPLAMTKAEK